MKKISNEIAVKLVLFTLALAMTVVIYLYQSYHQTIVQMTLEKALVQAESLSEQLNHELNHGALIVNTVKRYIEGTTAETSESEVDGNLEKLTDIIEVQVRDLMKGQKAVKYFSLYFYPDDKTRSKSLSFVVESDGDLSLRTWNITDAIFKASDDLVWRQIIEAGTDKTWSQPYEEASKEDTGKLFAYSDIVMRDNEKFCVIVIEFSPVALFSLQEKKNHLAGHYVLADGKEMIYDKAWLSALQAEQMLPFFPGALASDNKLIYQMDRDGAYTATKTRMNDQWTVFGLYTKADIQAFSSEYLFPWVLITASIILFLGGALYWLTYSITMPLRALTQSVITYSGSGDVYDIPQTIKRKRNEFNVLAKAIHGLINRIVQFNEKIEFQNQELLTELQSKEKMIQEISVASKIIDASHEGICIADKDFKVTYANDMFTKITGFKRDEIFGKDISVLDPHQSQLSPEIYEELKMFSVWSGFVKQLKKDGSLYDQKLTLRTMLDRSGKVESYIATFEELSDMPLLPIEHRQYDPLTGLITKETLVSELKSRIQNRDHSFAFLLIGIDRFRAINQTLGHEFGDDILRRLTSRIINAIPTSGALLSRFGGDEFAIAMEYFSDKHQLTDLAENLIALTNEPFVFGDERVFITASVGICLFPEDAYTVEDLLKRTTSALHVAKESGRKTFKFFSREELELVNRHIKLMGLINEGWKNKEFYIVYQPKLDLRTETVIGAEALMRWKSPTIGEVSPIEFIPIAEELGIINEMGDWCIQEAASKVSEINTLGIQNFRMSINLSYYQLMDDEIINTVKDAINTCRILPESLELEITEGILMTNIKRASGILKKLKAVGVYISIDDFGTGYSSLNYLKNLPIDILKIDRSFLKDIPSEDGTLAKIIIQLAENLSMQVIAEGVETIEQIEFLKANRCYEAQGYYYSKPIEFVDFLNYCERQMKSPMK